MNSEQTPHAVKDVAKAPSGKRTLLVGYHAADLSPELLAGDVTCHTLDIYHRHAIEKVWHAKTVCSPHLPEGPWDLIRFKAGPKLMSGELTLDLFQEVRALVGGDLKAARGKWTLDYVGRERDRNELLDKVCKDARRVRDFSATWEASVPGGPKLPFVSYPGCFCHRRLDEGGLALAEVVTKDLCNAASESAGGTIPSTHTVPPAPSLAAPLRLLDMGCGCGLVGYLIATRLKPSISSLDLTLVDSHSRAVEAAELNARAFGLEAEVILSDNGTPARMDGTFDVFVGNPPYYSDYRIADVFLETAKRALKPGGVCYTVCKNAAGLEPVQLRYFPKVEIIKRRNYAVLRSVKVSD